ncbi:sel1 repeat family protein [Alcaligenaceae bacterium]|nr:sel1 repeat family protein [Alcaligenaceae bacterium]
MKEISIKQFNAATPEKFQEIMTGPPDIAAQWLATAAEHGVADAQASYGQMLLDGTGVQRNPAEALHWFKAAANADHAMGMNMVGRCYENGWGTTANLVVATYWFRLAANRGLDWGMYNYATSLALGRGTDADPAQAFAWLEKAAGLGHAKSWNILGGFYEDGREVEASMETAMDCYCRSAQGGDFRGQFNYARVLAAQGDIEQAICWLKKVPTTATPAFMEKARKFLSTAALRELRELKI